MACACRAAASRSAKRAGRAPARRRRSAAISCRCPTLWRRRFSSLAARCGGRGRPVAGAPFRQLCCSRQAERHYGIRHFEVRYYSTARASRGTNSSQNRRTRARPGYPRLCCRSSAPQEVDGRDKPGHGELAVNRGAYHILLPGIAGEREIGRGEGAGAGAAMDGVMKGDNAPVLLEAGEEGILRLTLNLPEQRNALSVGIMS